MEDIYEIEENPRCAGSFVAVMRGRGNEWQESMLIGGGQVVSVTVSDGMA